MNRLFILIFLGFLNTFFFPTNAFAVNARPFWTQKSSYIEGSTLYTVGIASHAKTMEQGRQQAWENGKKEISNFAQITDLSGIDIGSQMTYDEQNGDGTFNVFRLLKVDMNKLTVWKAHLMDQATEVLKNQNSEIKTRIVKRKEQVQTLQKQSQELSDLDAQARSIQENIITFNSNVQQYVKCGMTTHEVGKLLGKPRAVNNNESSIGIVVVNYGSKWLAFQNGVLYNIKDGTDYVEVHHNCP